MRLLIEHLTDRCSNQILSASGAFVLAYVARKLEEVVQVIDSLAELSDPQVELILLRSCIGVCKDCMS